MRAVVYAAHRARPAHLPGRPAPGAARVRRRGVLAPGAAGAAHDNAAARLVLGRARLRDADGAGRRVSVARAGQPGRCRPGHARAQRAAARGLPRARPELRGAHRSGPPGAAHGGRHPRGLLGAQDRRRRPPRRPRPPGHRAAVRHGRPDRAGAGISRADTAQDARARLHERRQRRGRGRDRGGAAPGRQRRRRARARRPGRRPAAPPDGRAVVQRPRPRPARAAAHGRGRAATRGRAAPGPGGGVRAVRAAGLPVHDGRAGRVRGARLPLGARVGQRGARSRRRALRDAHAYGRPRTGGAAHDHRPRRATGGDAASRGRGLRREQGAAGMGRAPGHRRAHHPRAVRRDRRSGAGAPPPAPRGHVAGLGALGGPSLRRGPGVRLRPAFHRDSCRRRRPGRRRRAPYRSTRPRSS